MRTTFIVGSALCAIVGLSALRIGAPSLNASTRQQDIVVRSLLPKLEITGLTQISPTTVRFILRNGYEKDITAVIITLEPGRVIRTDYVYAELPKHQQIASGASDDFLSGIDAPGNGQQVAITSVLFSDMTVEGDDLRNIRGVLEKRRAVKLQLGRVNPSLEKLTEVKQSLLLGELHRIRQLAESLPVKVDDAAPHDFQSGLITGTNSACPRHYTP